MAPTVYSFDIFDTVLTRSVGDPQAVFLCVGMIATRHGLIKISPAEFKQLRVRAETEARRTRTGGEVTIEDIYNCLAELSGWPVERARELRDMELEIESAGLRPVKPVAREVARARTAHGSVAFLSDMYLPATFLERKLRSHGLFQDGDHLLVSGELGATKHSGKLYLNFLGNLGIKPAELLHRGDNWISDVRTPGRLGIRTAHFEQGTLNRFEHILEQSSNQTGAVTSFLAGASRLSRLETETGSPHRNAIRDVSAGVAGPALFSYVVWLLQRAQQLGLKRIYFLARDGQILLKLAQRIAPAVGFSGELRYLHVSRQALRLPTSDFRDPDSLAWSLDDTTFLSLASFLDRVGLEVAGLEDLLTHYGIDPSASEKNLDRPSRRKLHGLIADERFRKVVGEVAQRRQQMLSEYLVQEKVVGTDQFAIVDLGWHGSLQVALERMLKKKGATLPVGFYFGLSQRAGKAPLGKREAFFFDEYRRTGCLERTYWVEPMMEVFCTADHGLTLGYESAEGRIKPVLKSQQNDPALAWGLSVQQDAILRFAGFALDGCGSRFDPKSLRASIHALLEQFWNHPTRAEAEAWGNYPYADDQTEACARELAEPFGLVDCLRSVYRGQLTPPHRAGWIAGGLRRSSGIVRRTLPPSVKFVSWIRRLGRRLDSNS